MFVEGTEGEVWDKNLRLLAGCWVGEGGAVWQGGLWVCFLGRWGVCFGSLLGSGVDIMGFI